MLWEMGLLPEIRVLPCPPWWDVPLHQTRDEALEAALGRQQWLGPEEAARARAIIESHFDELFHEFSQEFQPRR